MTFRTRHSRNQTRRLLQRRDAESVETNAENDARQSGDLVAAGDGGATGI
jgi:hypothetical protein